MIVQGKETVDKDIIKYIYPNFLSSIDIALLNLDTSFNIISRKSFLSVI